MINISLSWIQFVVSETQQNSCPDICLSEHKLNCCWLHDMNFLLRRHIEWRVRGKEVCSLKSKGFMLLGAWLCSANFMAVLLTESKISCLQIGQFVPVHTNQGNAASSKFIHGGFDFGELWRWCKSIWQTDLWNYGEPESSKLRNHIHWVASSTLYNLAISEYLSLKRHGACSVKRQELMIQICLFNKLC